MLNKKRKLIPTHKCSGGCALCGHGAVSGGAEGDVSDPYDGMKQMFSDVSEGVESGIDHIYYNLSIVNQGDTPIPCEFKETRSVALLQDPSQWHCSVIRFMVPTALIPIFFFQTGDYIITFVENNGTAHSYPITYTPQQSSSVPIYPNTQPVYSIQGFLDMVNQQCQDFASSFYENALLGIRFVYDSNTQNINIYFPTYASDTGAANWYWPLNGVGPKVYMNYNLFKFFSSIPHTLNGIGRADNLDVLINLNFTGVTVSYPFPAYPNTLYDTCYAEVSNVDSWYDVVRYLFTTGTIPVNYESQNTLNGSGANVTLNILTDFEPATGSGSNKADDFLQYYPPGEYRLLNLTGSTPLINIDLLVYAQLKDLTLVPVYVPPNLSCSVKLMFRRKK